MNRCNTKSSALRAHLCRIQMRRYKFYKAGGQRLALGHVRAARYQAHDDEFDFEERPQQAIPCIPRLYLLNIRGRKIRYVYDEKYWNTCQECA